MINAHDFDAILDNNTDVVGIDGDKIGGVGQIYVNDATGAASFVTVRTGLFGMRETFVPLDDAEFVDGAIRVPFTAEQVKDAPQVDEGGAITPQDEDLIYSFYGVDGVGGTDSAGGVNLAAEPHEGIAMEGDPGHGVLEESVHGKEAGVLDRDWSDADGDGQHLERVDGVHDPQDGMIESDDPRDHGDNVGERLFGGADRGAADEPAVDDGQVALGAKRNEGGLLDTDRRDSQRLRRYDRQVQDQVIRDDVDPQAPVG